MNHSRIRIGAAAALVAFALAGCSSGQAPAESSDGGGGLTAISVARVGITQDAALQLGIDHGFFEEEGLEVTSTVVANPPASLAAVQGGQVQIAYAPSIPVLNALSQGVGLQIVAAADGADADVPDSTGVAALPDAGIESPADLAGTTIAVPARNAQLEVTIASAIDEAGGDPSTVNWVVLDFASAIEAVRSGQIDAAGVVNPFTDQAEAAGLEIVLEPAKEFFGEGAVGLWTTGTSTAEQQPEAIAAFARAIARANEYATEHTDEAMALAAEMTGVDPDSATLVPPAWPTELDPDAVEAVNQRLVELGYLQQPVDLSNAFFSES